MDPLGDTKQIWRRSHASPPLRPREVHLWRVPLDGLTEELESLSMSLSSAERARALGFLHERDRTRFLVSRGALRHVLAGYIAVAPSDIVFEYGRRGKPVLSGRWASRLQFNVSHSNGIALYAVAGTRVGVDAEYLRPVPDALRIANRYFAPSEAATLRAMPPDLRRTAFFRCWTRKEAFVKALGEGLAIPLGAFEVSVADQEPAMLRSIAGSTVAAARWAICDLAPAPGYAGAVAFERRDGELTCCRFELSL
jgi:4'-phosphopantetheinyl transferase